MDMDTDIDVDMDMYTYMCQKEKRIEKTCYLLSKDVSNKSKLNKI